MNHPNIIHIYDIAETDGVLFIAVEYVAGKTLDQLNTRGERCLSIGWLLLRQTTAGLRESSQEGFSRHPLRSYFM